MLQQASGQHHLAGLSCSPSSLPQLMKNAQVSFFVFILTRPF
jgi:hypothetical protein